MVARATIEMTMPTGDEIKLPLTSRDVNAERLVQFRELFPEASTEGKFDLKKLAQLLGDAATDAPERYGLSWSGKSERKRRRMGPRRRSRAGSSAKNSRSES